MQTRQAAQSGSDKTLLILACVSFVFFAIHGGNHLLRGEAHDLLWMCNLAPLILGLGCFTAKPRIVAIPLMWLCFGTPLWVIDLLGGDELVATSYLPHIGGPIIGLLAVWRLGLPRGTWWGAFLGMFTLCVLARLVTPPEFNVMVAFSVWPGWEETFPDYTLYASFLLAVGAVSYLIVEFALSWALRSSPGGRLQPLRHGESCDTSA